MRKTNERRKSSQTPLIYVIFLVSGLAASSLFLPVGRSPVVFRYCLVKYLYNQSEDISTVSPKNADPPTITWHLYNGAIILQNLKL
jgi:hypothetical protein